LEVFEIVVADLAGVKQMASLSTDNNLAIDNFHRILVLIGGPAIERRAIEQGMPVIGTSGLGRCGRRLSVREGGG
jgi:hypothetical protein